MSVAPGVVLGGCLFSKAHCCFVLSIWRRLLMQAFVWDEVRARMKLGIAMAASRPIMATTIIISTSVKPARDLLSFITTVTFLFMQFEQGNRRYKYNYDCLFKNCRLPTAILDFQQHPICQIGMCHKLMLSAARKSCFCGGNPCQSRLIPALELPQRRNTVQHLPQLSGNWTRLRRPTYPLVAAGSMRL